VSQGSPKTPVFVHLLEQTPDLLRLHAESPERVASFLGYALAKDGLLPADFIRTTFAKAFDRPGWIGVYAVAPSGVIVGAGIFKSAPVDGVVEIGYGVSPDWEGRGVATAIAKGLCEIAFGRGASAVIAHTLPGGLASQRVLEKLGFTRLGVFFEPEDGEVFRFRLAAPSE